MTEAAESPSFIERTFDDNAVGFAVDMVEAGREAHDDAQAAQDGSRLETHQPYGSTYWLALHNGVVSRLCKRLEGAEAFTPRGAQYQLVVWNGHIVLPVKVIDSFARKGVLRVRTSQVRADLTNVNLPGPSHPTLFDDDDSMRELADQAIEVSKAAQDAINNVATKTIIAAYACSPRGGLQIVHVGIGTLDDRGEIEFSDSERLSLAGPPVTATKPVEAAGESWSDTPKPKPKLEAVKEDKTATGEDEPHDATDAPAAE